MSENKVQDKYALLIDYEYCTGCHSCETSCQKELGLSLDQWGIKVLKYGPVEINPKAEMPKDQWEWVNLPYPTKLCTLCEGRVKSGRLPTCVHNCPAECMQFGTIEELAVQLAYKPKRVLYSLK